MALEMMEGLGFWGLDFVESIKCKMVASEYILSCVHE